MAGRGKGLPKEGGGDSGVACWGAEVGEVMETAHTWEEVGSQKQRKQRELKLFSAAQPLPGGWPGLLAPPLAHLPQRWGTHCPPPRQPGRCQP